MTMDPRTDDTPAPAGVQVHTGFWALAFMLTFVRPRLELDGGPPTPQPWGDTFIWVAPGRHTIRCSFRWLIIGRAGDASITVDVPPGHVVHLDYQAPHWFVFIPGKWTVGVTQALVLDPASAPAPPSPALAPPPPAAPAAPATPAGWFADPGRIHEHRYWDGTRWTEHVANAGVSAVDPPAS